MTISLRLKLIGFSIGLVSFTTLLFYFVTSRMIRQDLVEEIGMRVELLAAATAGRIDGDMHDAVVLGEYDSDAFRTICTQLEGMRDATSWAEELYTFKPAGNGKFHFTVMSHQNPFTSIYDAAAFGVADKINQVISSGEAGHTGLYMSKDEAYISGLGPIKNAQGKVVGVAVVDYKNKDFKALYSNKLRLLGILGLIAVGVAGLIALWAVRGITNPIADTVGLIRAVIQDRDLTRRLKPRSGDEMGELTNTFNSFIEEIHDLMTRFQDNASKLADASRKLNGNGKDMAENAQRLLAEADQATTATNQTGEAIAGIAASARAGRGDVVGVVETNTQIGENLVEVNDAALAMSQDVQSLAISIEEVSETIRQVSRDVEDTNDITQKGAELTEQTDITVTSLGQAAKEIDAVVSVINQIAEKTNLLALNAAIEAARAGEAGRGFGVVAEEVKDLANQTGEATEDIQKKIETMQDNTRTAIQAIKDIKATMTDINARTSSIATAVDDQSRAIGQVEESVVAASDRAASVSDSVNQSTTFSKSVTEKAQQAADGADQIAAGADQIATAAQSMKGNMNEVCSRSTSTAKAAEVLEKQSADLSEMAEEFTRQIGVFKI